MSRQGSRFLLAVVVISILLVPIITPFGQDVSDVNEVDNSRSMQLAETNTTWHDDCSSTAGWISQNTSSGFDPKHPVLESGTLSSSGGYLSVTGIADPVTERQGPLYIKELSDDVSIDHIELFQAEVEFTYYSSTFGFLSVYLFDENKQKAVMLRLHDAWAASESHPESVFFDPGEVGDGTYHDEILFGSWTGFLRFWYNESTGAIVGELDDGTPNQATLKSSGTFDAERSIRYIGIQWSRHPGLTYNGDGYHLLDVQLTYEKSQPASDWLTGWMNRKSHQILSTPGAGVNYQVPIVVNFGSGTDSNNSVYCDSRCQPDFDDIRFTGSDGVTLLDYWRESYFDSDNATFWVEIKDNLDSDVSIYIYYGNTDCTTTSDGEATFVFFDDFDDGLIDASKWETYGPWTESGGVTAFSIVGDGGTSVLPDLMTDNVWDMRNKSIVSRWRINALTVNREWGVSCANTIGDDHTRLAYFLALNTSGNDNVRSYYDASAVPDYDYYNLIIGQYPPSVFMKTEFVSTPNNVTKNSWILDGNVLDTYSGNSFDSTPQRIFLGFYVHGYTNTLISGNLEMEFDYVYLRNQVGPEITHGSWSDSESWLVGWNYRKSHEILGASGAGENYQVEIVVHYGYGTDSGEDAYCGEQCQLDFDDIRFTDDDGHTLLDYWTESVIESDEATFWVEIRDNLDTNVSIYLYFGNTTCTTTSNGTATFAFFDDFENGNLDRWDMDTGWSISSTYFTDGAYGAYSPGGTTQPQLRHDMNQTESFLISIDARTFDNFNTFPFLMSSDVGSCYPCTFGWTNVLYHTGSYSNWPQNSTLNDNTWYTMQIGFDMSLGKVRGWKNDNYMGEVDFASTTGATPSNVSAFRPAGGTQSTRHLALDNVYIRKWIPEEPAHGAWEGPSTVSWHHDCSNTTGFAYNDTWNMNWMPWDIQTGTLASDGSMLSVTSVVTGSGWHGPVFEYELPGTLRVRDIENLTAVFDVDNSINSYMGYEVLMFGDSDRNPVILYAFHDGWAASRQGSYGVSYGFLNGSRVGYGSGYPVGWTSFSGIMNTSFTEAGLQVYVEGFGESILTGLSEADFNREIKYVAIASARFGSDPLLPVRIDEISLNYEFVSRPPPPPQPAIDDVEDFGYEAGTTENVILWNITNFSPTSYELYRDSGLLSSGVWPGGTQLEVDIDNLAPGEYNYTIVIFGDESIEVSDIVMVTVTDTTSPSLGNPSNINYELGSRGHTIVWSAADLYPSAYVITQDGIPIEGDVWTSGTIELDIDGLGLGVYNYSIRVNDTSGNVAIDSVNVTVVDTTSPFIDHPTDIAIDLGTVNIQITWRPSDLLPFNYEIYRNGTLVATGTWVSGENLNYSLPE
ncbi:MAG: DUF2341 domain-containing protein, partial [Candidatus Thorarchaeota archaeon]